MQLIVGRDGSTTAVSGFSGFRSATQRQAFLPVLDRLVRGLARASAVLDRAVRATDGRTRRGLNHPGLSSKHWDQERLYSSLLAAACSTGLEALRAKFIYIYISYISPSFDISDMWASYAFLAY